MVRKASRADIPAIREMADLAFRDTYKDMLSAGQIDYMMEMMYSERSLLHQMDGEGQVFLIEVGKGYISYRHDGMSDDGRSRFHIEKLYVMPAFQGTGLGRLLFEKACEGMKVASEGKVRVELNVNRHNPAVSFYEHLGMSKSSQGDFPIGEGYFMNDYIMAKDL